MSPETENNAHLALHGIVASLAFCSVVAIFFRAAPYHTPAPAIPIAVSTPAVPKTAPPAECLPSGTGGPCLPFSEIEKMMNAQPDAPERVPANPATANKETI